MRQIVLDIETTGLSPEDGHRIIEIAAFELVNRKLSGKQLHLYINPQCSIDPLAVEIHGIENEFLMYKPVFAQVAEELLHFILGAELIIHHADFDLSFLDYEFSMLKVLGGPIMPIRSWCKVVDTLEMARQKFPGQKNTLTALCKRLDINEEDYDFDGTCLDARMLVDVYLQMTSSAQEAYVRAVRQRTERLKERIWKGRDEHE